MAVALGLWPLVRPPRAALLAGGLLAGYAGFTLLSMAWAPSAARAFTEFNRVSLYLGIFALAVLVGTRGNVTRWADGIAIGITAVSLLALSSRLFPTVLPSGEVPNFLPSAITRLSYPVEYWNGLAILTALAVPLLLRLAGEAEAFVSRGLAVACIPALSATIYLTSSRGGVATLVVGAMLFVAFAARRWAAMGALLAGALGTAAAIAVLLAREELVNRPFSSSAAPGEGRSAAVLILLVCLGTGLAYALAWRFRPRGIVIPPLAGKIVVGLALLAAVAGIAVSNPVERFEDFKKPPAGQLERSSDPVKQHLLSGTGSGRWQYWHAALEEWKDDPIAGRGAGSYEAWWAQKGELAVFIRDAHSLYLEALGELGILGFALIAGALGTGVVVGARRLRASRGTERSTVAALLAVFVAFLVSAGIDWMWELTIVSVVGILVLGLLTGPATDVAARPRSLEALRLGGSWTSRRFALGAGALVLGWLVICAQALPLLAQLKINDSQAAVERSDTEQAVDDALAARNLQPWGADPYLQLALIEEQAGALDSASAWIEKAIARDPENWRLWLVQARVQTKRGAIDQARDSIARARALNPRSPVFAGEGG